ncbi:MULTISPECIES: hypothetical protein [Flavobacterium]|uniref:hypothetical protein n=1 Tax=Flavobacterium TaxID=237 RepID=UPI000B4DCDEB|nr:MULTISPECIES: hypothetical protein [Flavobacterium]OWP87504.1 hypothetical protein BWK60_03280 [Flavobacterium covae]
MTPQEFEQALRNNAREVRQYASVAFPRVAGELTLRFINGNFRAQGFQGATFKKWKKSKGTTLVKTGALRSATFFTTQNGQATIKNNMPYAKTHNEGFKGVVSVKAHTRNTYKTERVGTGLFTRNGTERTRSVTVKTGERTVKAHTRNVDIEKRQFMPIDQNDSPTLNNAIKREVTRDLKNLLK